MNRRTVCLLRIVGLCLAINCVSTGRGQDADKQKKTEAVHPVSQVQVATLPVVIAHRGASGYVPEHTTEAAAYAHALGSDYIEQDCVLSKDGVAVVLHDLTLDRVSDVAERFPDRKRADGHWYAMDLTWDELQQLNLHERFDPPQPGSKVPARFPRNQTRFRIASLAQHLKLINGMNHSRGTSTGVYVEIKSPAEHHKQGLDLSKAVIADLEAAGYLTQQKPVYLQCFDQAEVRRIRVDLKCQLPLIQLLSKTPTAKEIAEIARVADGVGVPIDAVITGTEISEGVVEPQVSSLVRLAHDNALLVHVWTFRLDALPNFTDDGNLLLGWLVRDGGVDGIFADQPDAVLKWRGKTQTANRRPGTFHLLNSPSRKSTVPNGRPGQ